MRLRQHPVSGHSKENRVQNNNSSVHAKVAEGAYRIRRFALQMGEVQG